MKSYSEKKEINRIEKRAIEAVAVASVIKGISQRIGKDEALAIFKEVNQQEAYQRGQNTAKTKVPNQKVIATQTGALRCPSRDIFTFGNSRNKLLEI